MVTLYPGHKGCVVNMAIQDHRDHGVTEVMMDVMVFRVHLDQQGRP